MFQQQHVTLKEEFAWSEVPIEPYLDSIDSDTCHRIAQDLADDLDRQMFDSIMVPPAPTVEITAQRSERRWRTVGDE